MILNREPSVDRESSTRWRTGSYVVVALLSATYILPLAPLGLNVYDEGVRLYGAQRVASGSVPYYDFFAYYAPGQFYWPAMLFRLFGERVMVARLGASAFIVLGAASVFAICRRAGLSQLWATVSVVALLVPIRSGDQFVM